MHTNRVDLVNKNHLEVINNKWRLLVINNWRYKKIKKANNNYNKYLKKEDVLVKEYYQ